MGPESIQVIYQRSLQSNEQNEQLRALMPRGADVSLRAGFARCAIDLACEHHSGLVRVVQGGEYGTAAALLRPLLETSTAAFWFIYVATCEQIRSLPTSSKEDADSDIPLLAEMTKSLIPTFPLIQTLSDGLKKGGRAKWLHKYTHGGTPQLARRFNGGGWSEAEVMLTLLRADLFGILGACLETVIAPNPALATYGFGRRDQLGGELVTRFGVSAIPPQPHFLPVGLNDGCGPPFDLH